SVHHCVTLSPCFFFFSSRRRHTRSKRDWSSDVCSSDLSCRYDRLRKQVAPLQVLLPLDPPDGDHSRDEGPHAESARVGPVGLQSTGAPNPAPPAKEHTMGHHTLRIADGSAPRRRTVMAGAALAGGLALAAPRALAAPGPRTAPAAPRSESGLADLIIDQIGRLEPAFDPDVTEYT